MLFTWVFSFPFIYLEEIEILGVKKMKTKSLGKVKKKITLFLTICYFIMKILKLYEKIFLWDNKSLS